MGVRSILIKVVFFIRWFPFHAGLGPLLMAVRRGRRSAAAAAEREVKRARNHASEARPLPVDGSQASASTNSSSWSRLDFHRRKLYSR